MKHYRCLYPDGAEVDVLASDKDEAERKTRRYIPAFQRTPTVEDHGEAWSIIDLVEYPDPLNERPR
jgi:hypothetical protein